VKIDTTTAMRRVDPSSLGPVAETLMVTLHARVAETRRPDGILRDPAAVALAARLDYDFSALDSPRLDFNDTLVALRARRIDRHVQAFLARQPEGLVVELGCGLDTRFERVDTGRATWLELDLPEVIGLRRQLLDERPRRRFVARSVSDPAWLDELDDRPGPSCLFVAEGLFPYLALADVRQVLTRLTERYPGSELVFDALAPWLARMSRWHPALRRLRAAGAMVLWGLSRPADVAGWAPGLRVLESWRYFDAPDPRLGWYRVFRWLPPIAGSGLVLRCALGVGEG
jgi:O-methyltransferase involved in polyketide biosynthesis